MAVDYEAWTRSLMEDIRSNGRPSNGPMAGRPLMILTTTGARTGEARSSVVTYSRDGDNYVIAASKSGAPDNPAWYYNLRANPSATVEADRETFKVRATEATGAERDRLYDKHAEERPEFRDYPNQTPRVIPVFVLERID